MPGSACRPSAALPLGRVWSDGIWRRRGLLITSGLAWLGNEPTGARCMRDTDLLQTALGLAAPWTVSGSRFDAAARPGQSLE
jgi:hypothetical protein